ncbi:MAG: type II secretion system protein GspE, partial [Anaerolineae bacterium]|nr:type II secretion system protein GspE [Anaerolineae bacterium]NIQ78931.1 type II secretion system protein GspE [Anaerolineae bacterium]
MTEEFYKKPLGDILTSRGVITPAQLAGALEEQKRTRKRLGEVLITLGLVAEEQVTEARALQLDVGYVNLREQECEPEAIAAVAETTARTYTLIPVRKVRDKLVIAMANPLDVEAIDLVQFETKCRVEPALATESRIIDSIDRQYGSYSTEDLQSSVQEAASGAEV